MNKIKKGYIIVARKLWDSNIKHKPPHFRELWIWLLGKVNHKDNYCDNILIKRGQTLTSIKEIQEELSWYVGYRKQKYKKYQIAKGIRRLCEENMIVTTKATRGLFITVCNYDYYQSPKNYEGNSEGNTKATRRQQESSTRNKNDKNIKKEKKEIYKERKERKEDLQTRKNKIITQKEAGIYLKNFHSKEFQKLQSEACEVLQYLNKQCNKNYPVKFEILEPIMGRLNENGITIKECKHIIDVKLHDPYFQSHQNFYNTHTLYGKKFYTYLTQSKDDFKERKEEKMITRGEDYRESRNDLEPEDN